MDDPRNDIYLHIDKKVKNFDFDYFQKLANQSSIYYVDRSDVRWCDFSQVKCELKLLKDSSKRGYQYYRLISGVDLSLKSNDEIHNFFNEHQGKEFVHFTSFEDAKKVEYRVENYHFMNVSPRIRSYIDKALKFVKKFKNIERPWDLTRPIRYGSNWFSITHELALYIISEEEWINKYFHHTLCPDELFLQTLVLNSKFKDNIYYNGMDDDYIANMRFVDWSRGNPHVHVTED